MCDILIADLGSEPFCLDERRFVLVISSRLPVPDRAGVMREAFASAGQDQPPRGPAACLCGIAADAPASRARVPRLSPGARRGLAAAAITGYLFGLHVTWHFLPWFS